MVFPFKSGIVSNEDRPRPERPLTRRNGQSIAKIKRECPSSEESDERTQPPTPPPRHFLRKSGGSFRLPCLTKQTSHEKPILVCSASAGESPPPSGDRTLMSRIAASLRFSPLPVMAVAGVNTEEDPSLSPVDRRNHVPLHRASYHGE
ncbi:CAC1F_C domain-containing protein [Trichonephila clavipes]|nr:CAC1F_C domain-containing protein [Trichonephila clavipes]